MATKKYKLKEPIEVDGSLLKEVTLRSPKVKDTRGKDVNDPDFGYQLLASCTGLSPSVIDEMDLADAEALAEMLKGFRGAGN